MRLRIERDVLADAVGWAARCLPSRTTVPVLAGMLIEAKVPTGDDRVTDDARGVLRLSAFDYETCAQATADATVDEPGRFVVSGRLLAEIARILPAEPVQITTDGAKLVVSCGDTRFTLLTMPVEDYPALPPMPPVIGTVAGDVLATAVGQVAIAAGRDETLPLLTTIRLAVTGDELSMVATDRFRMAARRFTWQPLAGTAPGHVVLVPAKAFASGIKAIGASAQTRIGLAATPATGGTIGIESDGRRLVVRLLDERPVDYLKVFPTSTAGWSEVPSAALIDAVKRVSLVASKLTPVLLAFSPGRVRLEAGAGEEAHAVTAVEADLHGEPVSIAFNPHFLLDGITALDADVVRFEYLDERRPVLLTGRGKDDEATGVPEYRYLVVPLRVG